MQLTDESNQPSPEALSAMEAASKAADAVKTLSASISSSRFLIRDRERERENRAVLEKAQAEAARTAEAAKKAIETPKNNFCALVVALSVYLDNDENEEEHESFFLSSSVLPFALSRLSACSFADCESCCVSVFFSSLSLVYSFLFSLSRHASCCFVWSSCVFSVLQMGQLSLRLLLLLLLLLLLCLRSLLLLFLPPTLFPLLLPLLPLLVHRHLLFFPLLLLR